MTTKLLIQQPPIQVLPSLAVAIGLNEAIVLQQMHWLTNYTNFGKVHDGERWIFNTYEQWQKRFPFWSQRTIQRVFLNLEELGVIRSRVDLNEWKADRTKWYAIDYAKLETMEGVDIGENHPTRQIGTMGDDAKVAPSNMPDWHHGSRQVGTTDNQRIPKNTQSNTSSSSDDDASSSIPEKPKRTRPGTAAWTKATYHRICADPLFQEFWNAYPRHVGKEPAARQWLKVNPSRELVDTMLKALEWQRVQRRWLEDVENIPHASTWLNNSRWEDERPATGNGTTNADGTPQYIYGSKAYAEIEAQAGNLGLQPGESFLPAQAPSRRVNMHHGD